MFCLSSDTLLRNDISILIVENAKTLNSIISMELVHLGYSCNNAFSLKNIKEEITKKEFDYIVINLYLLDAQEEELITSVNAITDAKIIVLTSVMNDKLRDKLFKYGILDYLYKQNIEKTINDIHTLIKNVEINLLSNVLIIDDSKTIREKIKGILKLRNYNVLESQTGKGGLEIIRNQKIDLLILDMQLDDIHGLEVLKEIKSDYNNSFPVVAVSGTNDSDVVRKALKGGALDFIRKPIILEEFLLKSDLWIDYYRQSKELKEYKNDLEEKLEKGLSTIKVLNKEIEDTQAEVIYTVGAVGESRSKETGNHVRRVAKYSKLLALLSGLDQNEAELLELASPMHDIGKIAIPESILNKPGHLSQAERKIMMNHPKYGFDMLNNSNRTIMKTASIVAYEHHEKYDGSGYPRGLIGEEIHLYGRITALADVFDALASKRVYKDAWKDDDIWALFEEEKGKHFDPKLVELFFENIDKFLYIRSKYVDKDFANNDADESFIVAAKNDININDIQETATSFSYEGL